MAQRNVTISCHVIVVHILFKCQHPRPIVTPFSWLRHAYRAYLTFSRFTVPYPSLAGHYKTQQSVESAEIPMACVP